ncbi:MAG: DMT family transporter [Filomicrobium sp.]|nr:DMT family transporter [Filomicrobium sp.]
MRDFGRAIAMMAVALILFSCLDATAKYLAGRVGVPVTQIIWVRFLGQFFLMLTFVPLLGLMDVRSMFRTRRLPWQLARSTLMVTVTALNFLALKYLRLDQTVTITFLAPLVVALLGGPLLGEWVGWRRLIAILVGFGGILIVVRPGFAEIHPAVGFSFASMLAYALFMLITRHIAGEDPPIVTLFYSMFVGVFLGAPFAISEWQWPQQPEVWLMLLSLGAFGGAGHYLFILAYKLAPASRITPFLYLQILSMAGLGYLVFGDLPDIWTAVGSCVVVCSGIYLIDRERRVRAGER